MLSINQVTKNPESEAISFPGSPFQRGPWISRAQILQTPSVLLAVETEVLETRVAYISVAIKSWKGLLFEPFSLYLRNGPEVYQNITMIAFSLAGWIRTDNGKMLPLL